MSEWRAPRRPADSGMRLGLAPHVPLKSNDCGGAKVYPPRRLAGRLFAGVDDGDVDDAGSMGQRS